MSDLTKVEQRVMDKAKEIAKPFTPTEIGVALGHPQVRASSKMAPTLKTLVEKGKLTRTQTGHNKVTYKA